MNDLKMPIDVALAGRMKHHYRDALAAQNACNLAGVANSLNRMIPDIRESLVAETGSWSTEAINRHPIVQLFCSKLHDLAGMGLSDQETYEQALRICEERGA